MFKMGKKDRGWKKWLYNTIGEPPVILDTLLTNKSVKQIKLYLNSKGYLNSQVKKEIIYKKEKAIIKYIINSAEPYCIRNINYSIDNDGFRSLVINDTVNSLIKKGDNYDADVFQSERERITTNLKNDGYYYFSKEYISYSVDSAFGNHKLDITMEIRDPVVKLKEPSANGTDSLIKVPHKRYLINNINIFTDFSSLNTDTIRYKKFTYLASPRKKSDAPDVYNFLYKDTLKIRPKTITQSIFFKQGDYFNLKDVDRTYTGLMDLKMFKFVNIQFNPAEAAPSDSSKMSNPMLDCEIQLTRTPIQSFSVETEATNSAGNLGVAGNFLYQNKNIFRGAEIFNFKISGAMEIQKILGVKNSQNNIQKILPFNTIETGAEAGFVIPKFMIPVKQERFPKRFNPKTIINTGINYQKRPDYTRYILNASYGFEWKESQYKKHIVYIPEINSVKIYPTTHFDSIINSLNDPKIKNSYKDHLTMAFKYSFIYNNQQVNKNKNFSYLRLNFETSGNILRAINNIFNNYQFADGSYTMFYIKYAEYIRADADYRRYLNLTELSKLVFRGMLGYGLAYWNSTVLPFEKSFFAGGANSIRAWRIYSLGPGSYKDPAMIDFNRTGDIDIESNLEYRFPIYGFLKGAFFVDAGNIWLNKKNLQMPDAEFEWNRFYKEFAIGGGFGARFDFDFFIMRLDAAIPFKDPSKPENKRWGLNEHVNFNLGIGYPF
jgi:outer membrane protein assembly factor BamA